MYDDDDGMIALMGLILCMFIILFGCSTEPPCEVDCMEEQICEECYQDGLAACECDAVCAACDKEGFNRGYQQGLPKCSARAREACELEDITPRTQTICYKDVCELVWISDYNGKHGHPKYECSLQLFECPEIVQVDPCDCPTGPDGEPIGPAPCWFPDHPECGE